MSFIIKSDVAKVRAMLIEPLQKEADFIMSHAINQTLLALKKRQSKEIAKYLDKKTGVQNYTKKDNYIIMSKKRDLVGSYGWGYRSHYTPNLVEDTKVKARKGTLVELNTNPKIKTAISGKGRRLKKDIVSRARSGQLKNAFIGTFRGVRGVWQKINKYTPKTQRKLKKEDRKPRYKNIALLVSLNRKSRLQKQRYPSADLAVKFVYGRFDRQIIKSMRYSLNKYRAWAKSEMLK
jgi:hypothetical protein